MTRSQERTPAPPVVQGAPAARLRDALRIVWWSQRGYRHGAAHGHPAARALSALLWCVSWVVFPLSVLIQLALLGRRRARYYMTPTGDAVLAITATAKGWQVADHLCARPGTGQGRPLRDLVLPPVRVFADETGTMLYLTAVNKKMARTYAADLPGLHDVGRAWPRGRRMRREPTPRP